MMEPVAWTSEVQLQRMKRQPGYNHLMWGEPLPFHHDIPLVRLSDAEARIAELEEAYENQQRANVYLSETITTAEARAEAAEALLKEARDKALEDAAFVLDCKAAYFSALPFQSWRHKEVHQRYRDDAAAIRALKEKP